MKKKLLALLLAAVLVLVFFGCTPNPDAAQDNTQPTVTDPPPPDPAEVYAEAKAKLDGLDAVTLDVTVVTTTRVEDQDFVKESEQVLTYAGLGTDDPMAWMQTELPYKNMEQAINDFISDAEESDEEATTPYSEIYADGKLYVELKDEAFFSGDMTAEEYAGRYVPAVLLDETLYGELKLDGSGSEQTVTFASATGAETWAMPESAQMQEASGSAVIGADGALKEMNYTLHYTYGTAEVCLEVEAKPRAEALTVAVPEDTEQYLPLQFVDALQMSIYAEDMLKQAENATASSSETAISHAAGAVYATTSILNMQTSGDDIDAKIETGIHVSDAVNGAQSHTQEELFKDGKYVLSVAGGLPTTQVGITNDMIEEYCDSLLNTSVPVPQFWQEVTMTDLGSVYLLEFDFGSDFGDTMQNAVCTLFWQDPSFLNRMATAYENKEMTGYMAIDKYTGLPTAAGYNFEGVHTIDGEEWSITMERSQAMKIPSFGAYKEISGELKAETEPESKATPLFYRVTGDEGQEMWLLGTIHIGDERTGFLPQEIYDAFAASDALALECDSEAFDAQLEAGDSALMDRLAKAYYYRDGSQVADYLDEELYKLAVQYLKASGDYSENMNSMKVALWESSISNFYLQQGHQLHTEQGLESRLTQLAKEQEKPIREVESSIFQIEMLTGWSDELQKVLLEETLSYSAEEYWADTYALYELWCAGDEEALRQEINEQTDTSELTDEELAEYEALLPLYEEYDKGMQHDRNEDMLDVAVEYLESGEVVFYAVGLAHLLDDTNGLVDALREAGYTVELVTYFQ